MKKYILIFSSIISILVSCWYLLPKYKQNSMVRNFNLYTVLQREEIENNNNDILPGYKQVFEFKSKYQNLGSVEVLIDNHGRVNKDQVVFRIKETGKNDWIYQNTYKTSAMDVGQFFPFGFNTIGDSKNRSYTVEIESLNGSNNDSVSISNKSDYIHLKYLYNSDYLTNNITKVPEYLSLKIIEFINLFSFIDFIKTYFISSIPFVIVIFIGDTRFGGLFDYYRYKLKIKPNIGLLAIFLLYFLSHIQFLNYSQYWDSDWYWQLLLTSVNSVVNFDGGSILDFLKMYIFNFNFLGHPSIFYFSYLSLGQYLDYGNVFIMNLQNVILAMVGIYGFYCICVSLFSNNKYENLLLTLFFAFNPLFYATSISLNTDMPILVFEVLVVLSLIKQNKIAFLLWSLAIIFSKETGILIYVSITSSFILLFEYKRLGFSRRILTDFVIYIIPLLVFLLYFYLSGGNMHSYESVQNTGNSLKLVWDDNGFFTFGLNSKNFFVRFFQLVIMNFGWIGTLIMFSSYVKSMVFDTSVLHKYSRKVRDLVRFILYSSVPFIILTLLFITMEFSRYVVPVVFYFCLLMYVHLRHLVNNKWLRIIILIVLCVLNIIQTFKSIDPSHGMFYGINKIGSVESSPVFGYRDGLVYNSQFVFVDRLSYAIESIVKDEKVIIDTSAEYFFKRILHVGTVKNVAKINDERLVYVYIPWFDNPNEGLNSIKDYYSVESQKKIEYKGYYVYLYYLNKIK